MRRFALTQFYGNPVHENIEVNEVPSPVYVEKNIADHKIIISNAEDDLSDDEASLSDQEDTVCGSDETASDSEEILSESEEETLSGSEESISDSEECSSHTSVSDQTSITTCSADSDDSESGFHTSLEYNEDNEVPSINIFPDIWTYESLVTWLKNFTYGVSEC